MHLMHEVWTNYNSCTTKNNEYICISSGGVQEKGKTIWKLILWGSPPQC